MRWTMCVLAAAIAFQPSAAPLEQFSGSTPCGSLVREFLGIPITTPCERVTWRVHLQGEAFGLEATYGMQAVNAPGFADGAESVRARGRWRSGLMTAENGRSLRFALIERTLLHVADRNGRLLIGDAGWSYTLTRTTLNGAPPEPRAMTAPETHIPALSGDFAGRTPCQETSRLVGREPAPDCAKLKWGLTLNADGTYRLEGTLYRSAPRTGMWKLRRDRRAAQFIYELDAGSAQGTILLLRATDDLLFFLEPSGALMRGNASHSYTLNRGAR